MKVADEALAQCRIGFNCADDFGLWSPAFPSLAMVARDLYFLHCSLRSFRIVGRYKWW